MGPERIWGLTSNVHSLGRCRAPEGLSQSLRSVAFITGMNALQRNDMGADAVLANDRFSGRANSSKSFDNKLIPREIYFVLTAQDTGATGRTPNPLNSRRISQPKGQRDLPLISNLSSIFGLGYG